MYRIGPFRRAHWLKVFVGPTRHTLLAMMRCAHLRFQRGALPLVLRPLTPVACRASTRNLSGIGPHRPTRRNRELLRYAG